MEYFQENWLPILVAIYLLGMVLYGHYRGFIRLAVSLTALIITLVAVNAALPHVTDYLEQNTSLRTTIGEGILQSVGLGDDGPQEYGSAPEEQVQVIEGLSLPDSVKEDLIFNNNSEIYQILGVEAFADYISAYLADIVIQSLAFIILFIVVFILIQILVRWLDLIAKLPILSGMNQIAGALLGGILGLLYFWIGCMVLSVFTSTEFGIAIMEQIEKTGWLYALYENNLLSIFMAGIIKGIF